MKKIQLHPTAAFWTILGSVLASIADALKSGHPTVESVAIALIGVWATYVRSPHDNPAGPDATQGN